MMRTNVNKFTDDTMLTHILASDSFKFLCKSFDKFCREIIISVPVLFIEIIDNNHLKNYFSRN